MQAWARSFFQKVSAFFFLASERERGRHFEERANALSEYHESKVLHNIEVSWVP